MRAVGELGERLGTRAEIVVGIGEIALLADQPDRQAALALTSALQDAGIEHRSLVRGLVPTSRMASA